MTRLSMVFVTLCCSLSTAAASLAPSREGAPSFGKNIPAELVTQLAPQAQKAAHPPEEKEKQEYQITDKTEVQLDGKACKYDDVPDHAEVILLEVSSNKKDVAKLYFRTKASKHK